MAFGRRRKTRRPRKAYRPKRPMMRRKRLSKFSRRRQLTGIGPKKFMKVRKDILYTVVTTAASWNSLIVGGAQVTGPSQFSYFNGASVSAVDTAVDTTGPTGISQWLAFYNRFYVCGSKMKVTILGNSETLGDNLVATLVPTIGSTLACDEATGAIPFDTRQIDPGELPYARRIVVNGASNAGGSSKSLSSYISVKKMLGVKDLSDINSERFPSVANTNNPYVPSIEDATTTGITQQSNTGTLQEGIYWNFVVQNIQQNQSSIPMTAVEPSFSCRIQLTQYICFTDRKPLTTV